MQTVTNENDERAVEFAFELTPREAVALEADLAGVRDSGRGISTTGLMVLRAVGARVHQARIDSASLERAKAVVQTAPEPRKRQKTIVA
jgi:hypothetical protein